MHVWNNYYIDEVEEIKIIKLLKKSKHLHSIRWLIPDIIFLIKEDSITNKVLDYCINYKGKFRKTLLVQLAHMRLTPEQLIKINNLIDTPEAFCKLVDLYINDDKYSIEGLNELLVSNAKYINEVEYLLKSLNKTNKKTKVIRDFLGRKTEDGGLS